MSLDPAGSLPPALPISPAEEARDIARDAAQDDPRARENRILNASSPPWSTTTKAIFAAASLLLFAIVIWRFNTLIQPLILAAVIAYLLNPIVNWSSRRFRIQRGTAVAIVYLGFILIVLGLLVVIGFVAVDQSIRLFDALPSLIERSIAWAGRAWETTWQFGPFQFTPSQVVDNERLGALVDQGIAWLQSNFARGGTLAARAVSATLSVLSTLFVVMFVAIYLSRDTPMLWRAVGDIANAPGYRRDAERLTRDFVRIWNAYLRGQVLLGISMFVVVSLTLAILGVNYALALGGLAGLLEFLPVLGPAISMVAAVLVAIFQDANWLGLAPAWYALVVLGAMLALQQIEQAVLVPRFVGEALDLHPVTVIVVVLMGTSLAGILGAVLAAPVAASVKLVGGYGWRKMFDLPPFPDPEPHEETRAGPGLPASLRGLFRRTNKP